MAEPELVDAEFIDGDDVSLQEQVDNLVDRVNDFDDAIDALEEAILRIARHVGVNLSDLIEE